MQKHLKNTPPTLPIDGYCHPQFEAVRLAFIKNMASESEIGAAVSIVLHGQTVVDLWGGYRDVNYTSPWQQDTLVCVMSVTKAIASFVYWYWLTESRLIWINPLLNIGQNSLRPAKSILPYVVYLPS